MAKQRSRFSYDKAYYENLAKGYAFEGNAARKLYDAEPEEEYEDDYLEREDTAYADEREEGVQEEHQTCQDKVKVVRSYQFSAIYAFLVLVCVGMMVMFAINYLNINEQLNQNAKDIKTARTALETVEALNESLTSELDRNYDRNYIYSVAVGRLNMVYPTANKVVYYETANESSVRQYSPVR